MRRNYVDTKLGQIHYREEGMHNSSTIIFIHQIGQSGSEFGGVMTLLASEYRVVAPDLPGYGYSDFPLSRLSIEDYAENVKEVCDLLGIKETALVGHHGGAIIGVDIAARYPEFVKKAVFSGFTAPPNVEVMKPFLDSPMFNYKPIDDEGLMLAEKWRLYRSWFKPGTPQEVWYWPFIASLLPREQMHDGHKAAFVYDSAAKLPLIQCPVLLLRPTRDQFVTDPTFTKSLIKDCRTIEMDAGILAPVEAPEEFARIVLDFLKN